MFCKNIDLNPIEIRMFWIRTVQTWSMFLEDEVISMALVKHTKKAFQKSLLSNCCCCSVTKLHPILCDTMNWSTPGFPVLHYLAEFAQNHVDWVGDVIQPSYPLLPPSLPAFNLFQHQGFFQWVAFLYQAAKVLELQYSISHSNEHSGFISLRTDWLDLLVAQGSLKSLLQHHSLKASILLGTQPLLWSNSHIHASLLEKP